MTKGQGREHLCDTSMPVRNGNLGNDRTTPSKAVGLSMRKQLSTKHSKSNDGRQETNGGVMGRDRSAEEHVRETGGEKTTVDRTRGKDCG